MSILVHAKANEQIILVQYCKPLLGQWNFNIGLTLGQDCNVVWEICFHVAVLLNQNCQYSINVFYEKLQKTGLGGHIYPKNSKLGIGSLLKQFIIGIVLDFQ